MKSRWLDLLLIPVIAGVIVALVQFGIPRLLEKRGLELSYSVEPPKVTLDKRKVPDVKVQINGLETALLATQSAHVWNSGADPIMEIPIQYVFDTSSPNFKIFAFDHQTKPKFQFGSITPSSSGRATVTFTYHLINHSDEFTATFLTNEAAPLSLYGKVAGLSFRQVAPVAGRPSESPLLVLTTFVVSLLSTLAAAVTFYWRRRWFKRE